MYRAHITAFEHTYMKTLNKKTLNNILNSIDNCFFLNIGANDGITNDPLYECVVRNKWSGICVEPGDEMFLHLKDNLQHIPGIVYEKCVITDNVGTTTLFKGTTNQHFSLCEKYANWMYDVTPTQETVSCTTTRDLLQKYNVEKIDVVNIDTEGHESVILLDFPFESVSPKVIIAEFAHVEFANSHVNIMTKYLEEKGYNCFYNEDKTDVIGVRNDINIDWEETGCTCCCDDADCTVAVEFVASDNVEVLGDIEQHITKRVDIAAHDGLSAYKSNACQQHHNVFRVFFDFLKQTKPSNIIEIGTALGGFTSTLKEFVDTLNLNCNILSYDIHENSWYKDMIASGIDVRVENIFSNNYTEVKQEVKDFIARDGVTVVLCDGGSKIDEFNTLSNFLKPGDFILAHDYGHSAEIFNETIKNKIWNWCEITNTNIQDACVRNNLIEYDKQTFNSVVWTCRVKAF